DGRLQREALLHAEGAAYRARARDDHGAGWNLERRIGASTEDTLVHEIVHRRATREDHARTKHGTRAHHGAFIHTAVPADRDVVFDDHGRGVDRLQHAADLRGGAQVHALSDLRARTDQRVRIDHRARADIGADVHIHRRHTHHA